MIREELLPPILLSFRNYSSSTLRVDPTIPAGSQSGPVTQVLLISVYLAMTIVSGMRNDPCLTNRTQLWDSDIRCTSKMVFLVDIYTSSWLRMELTKRHKPAWLGFRFTIIKGALSKTEHTMAYFTYKGISKILKFPSNKPNTDDMISKKLDSCPVLPSLEFREFVISEICHLGKQLLPFKLKQNLTTLYIFLDMKERINY